MARLFPVLMLAGLLALVALACDDNPPPSAVDDEAYLAVMCANLDRFSDAVQVETEESGIAAVIQDFIDALEAVEPPADLQGFHDAFLEYLEDALDDPTSPLVLAPPSPTTRRVSGWRARNARWPSAASPLSSTIRHRTSSDPRVY